MKMRELRQMLKVRRMMLSKEAVRGWEVELKKELKKEDKKAVCPRDRGVGKAAGALLVGEELDILPQAALVAFQGEDVIGLLVNDLAGDCTLAAAGVDGGDGALDLQQIQQLGDGHDLVDLSATAVWPSTRRCRAANAETRCSAALPLPRVRREVLRSKGIARANRLRH